MTKSRSKRPTEAELLKAVQESLEEVEKAWREAQVDEPRTT